MYSCYAIAEHEYIKNDFLPTLATKKEHACGVSCKERKKADESALCNVLLPQILEASCATGMSQTLQRFFLNLADALARHTESLANNLKG